MSLTENLGLKKSIDGGLEKLSKDNDNFNRIDAEITNLKDSTGTTGAVLYIDNVRDFLGALYYNTDYIYINDTQYENRIKEKYSKLIITKNLSLDGFNSLAQTGYENELRIPSHVTEIVSKNTAIDFNNKYFLSLDSATTIRELALQNIGNGTTAINAKVGYLSLYNVIIYNLNGCIEGTYNYTVSDLGNYSGTQDSKSSISNVTINGIQNNIILFKNINNINTLTLNLLQTDIGKTATIFHSVGNIDNFFINYNISEYYSNFKGIYLTSGSYTEQSTNLTYLGGLINSNNIVTNNCSIGGLVGNPHLIQNIYQDITLKDNCLFNCNNLFIDVYETSPATFINCCNIVINLRVFISQYSTNNILTCKNALNIRANGFVILKEYIDATRRQLTVSDNITLSKYDRLVDLHLNKAISITLPADFLNVYKFKDVLGLANTYNVTIIAPEGYTIEGNENYIMNVSNADLTLALYNDTFYVV